MTNTGFLLTDWIFFFSKKNKASLSKIFESEQNKDISDEFVTWKLITAFLPLIPFILVFLINISTSSPHLFYTFINNGSLPIISFGIISSGMPYLLEQLREYPEYHSIRRRVMAVSMFFMFLSAALYIVQTMYIINVYLNCISNFLSLVLSIYIYLFSNSVGYKMFILQSKNIESFSQTVTDQVENLKDALNDLD